MELAEGLMEANSRVEPSAQKVASLFQSPRFITSGKKRTGCQPLAVLSHTPITPFSNLMIEVPSALTARMPSLLSLRRWRAKMAASLQFRFVSLCHIHIFTSQIVVTVTSAEVEALAVGRHTG